MSMTDYPVPRLLGLSTHSTGPPCTAAAPPDQQLADRLIWRVEQFALPALYHRWTLSMADLCRGRLKMPLGILPSIQMQPTNK